MLKAERDVTDRNAVNLVLIRLKRT